MKKITLIILFILLIGITLYFNSSKDCSPQTIEWYTIPNTKHWNTTINLTKSFLIQNWVETRETTFTCSNGKFKQNAETTSITCNKDYKLNDKTKTCEKKFLAKVSDLVNKWEEFLWNLYQDTKNIIWNSCEFLSEKTSGVYTCLDAWIDSALLFVPMVWWISVGKKIDKANDIRKSLNVVHEVDNLSDLDKLISTANVGLKVNKLSWIKIITKTIDWKSILVPDLDILKNKNIFIDSQWYAKYIDNGSYKTVHKTVAEEELGRKILWNIEEVHHIDNNPLNNSPSNLCVLIIALHKEITSSLRNQAIAGSDYQKWLNKNCLTK
jgi:hypothetical protein